jgi:5-carboxymethyl-2-hydroxymuconate isomerase
MIVEYQQALAGDSEVDALLMRIHHAVSESGLRGL